MVFNSLLLGMPLLHLATVISMLSCYEARTLQISHIYVSYTCWTPTLLSYVLNIYIKLHTHIFVMSSVRLYLNLVRIIVSRVRVVALWEMGCVPFKHFLPCTIAVSGQQWLQQLSFKFNYAFESFHYSVSTDHLSCFPGNFFTCTILCV